MVAYEGVSSKEYRKASLKALDYFRIAHEERMSVLTVLRNKNEDFRTMLEILEKGKTSDISHRESIIKALEKAEFLSCDHLKGYCKVTDEGIKVVEEFKNAANTLDTILKYAGWLGMGAFDEKYIIPKGVDYLRESGVLHHPFIPKGDTDAFVEAFVKAKGKPHGFILQLSSLYHISALLQIAGYIIFYEELFKRFTLTCDYLRYLTKDEIKEMLSNGDRYPTGERLKEILREFTKEYKIPELKSPLQAFSSLGLIKNLKGKVFCIGGEIKRYEDDRYELTDRGKELIKYIILHILLS